MAKKLKFETYIKIQYYIKTARDNKTNNKEQQRTTKNNKEQQRTTKNKEKHNNGYVSKQG